MNKHIAVIALVMVLCFTPCAVGFGANLPTTDRAGYVIALPETVTSIVTMAPSITQTLVDLGLLGNIIAMDTQSAMLIGGAGEKPTFDMLAPDVESIASMNPDLILVSGMSMLGGEINDPYAAFKQLGICVAYIPSSDSIAGIKDDLRFIGAIVNKNAEIDAIIADMDAQIAEIIAQKPLNLPAKTVYFEISAAPYMYSFGGGVFLNEMIEMLGARNVFADQDSWLSVEAESVVSLNPDVIFTNVNYIDDPVGEILSRPGFENVSAVENKQVFYIDTDASVQPNNHIVLALKQMAKCLFVAP